jgi:hypothetical protein
MQNGSREEDGPATTANIVVGSGLHVPHCLHRRDVCLITPPDPVNRSLSFDSSYSTPLQQQKLCVEHVTRVLGFQVARQLGF